MGRLAREAAMLSASLTRTRDGPTVLVFPGENRTGGASNLRGYLVAEQLAQRGWNAHVVHCNLSLKQRRRIIRWVRPDVILIQMARHPLNRPALYDAPAVFDIDDADYVDAEQAARIIEAVKDSAAVIAGSRSVADFCSHHNENVHVVWTGTPISNGVITPQTHRSDIVAWAALLPHRCAAEAEFLVEVLALLKKRGVDFQFLLYCDDGSQEYRAFSDTYRSLGITVLTRPLFNSYSSFLRSLDDVAVGLAPLVDVSGFSGGKSFGKVLAYMDRGIPVVTHPVVDHPLFFESGRNGAMAQTVEEWADVITELLADPILRQRLADAARYDLSQRLTVAEAAARVDAILRSVISNAQRFENKS